MKIKKNIQLSLMNRTGGGRKGIHDPSIRHIARPIIKKNCSMHLTIKIHKEKAGIKNKGVLQVLKRAIKNARLKDLKIIHFTLEYDHVHLLVEANNKVALGRGMMVFGVTMAKGINRIKNKLGSVYKHRYHLQMIKSARELKNVMNYIFKNGIKHKTVQNIINPYHSLSAEVKYKLFYHGEIKLDFELMNLLDRGKVYHSQLDFLK